MFRNIALSDVPEPLPPQYAACSDAELTKAVTLVVTVKDTCDQATELLTHLASIFPTTMPVIYAYPDIRGCRSADISAGYSLFDNFTVLSVEKADAPIAGFLKAQKLLKTKYAVLMHNDAYPMERDFACELYRALEANPHYPIAAPQIYEAGERKIIVPHGHHQNLHVRPTATGQGLRIDYDLSMKLLTQRRPEDFHDGPQVDFLEDHAFFARSDVYHELLDPAGSFTMEYMDMILNMRSRNTSAWYVPTARCIFEVDTAKITWKDLPYLVYKRSEQVGHQVRVYLTKKWGVEFPNSGIWNYVRYVMLNDIVMEGKDLPTDWQDQAAVFYSWFESVGFNRYNGKMLPEYIEEPSPEPVTISRTMAHELPTDVPADRVPPKQAVEVLPRQERKKVGAVEVSFKDPHIEIALKKASCDASKPESYSQCGLAVQDGDSCTCWTYVVPFNLRTTLYLDRIADMLKLPSRALMYAQMKFWRVPIDKNNVEIYCDGTQEDCKHEVHFTANSKVLQWSWFGKQHKYPVTFEGLMIFCTLALLLAAPVVMRTPKAQAWMGTKKQQLRVFTAFNKALCRQGVRM
jgi:hypothetical protein